jgi:hypothetical protein
MRQTFEEQVRLAVLRYKQRRRMSCRDLCEVIRRRDGQRYHPKTLQRFVRGDEPGRWSGLAARAFDTIAWINRDVRRGWKR